MTFTSFEKAFASKYPEGKVFGHGTFGGTEGSAKVTVCFTETGKAYKYSGSYENILNRLGIKFVTKKTVDEYTEKLRRAEEMNGEESGFDDDEPMDFTAEIEYLKNRIAELIDGAVIV